jgi:hypothetical protein
VTTIAPPNSPGKTVIVFNDQPVAASATVTSSASVTAPNLDGIFPTFDYVLLNSSGTHTDQRATAPKAAGSYTVTASFPGDLDYAASTGNTVSFTIQPATPTITFANLGGTYSTNPQPATALVNGVDTSPGPSLEGVSLVTATNPLLYYSGTFSSVAAAQASGPALPGAPTIFGKYTVVASFPGSADYAAAKNFANFSINKSTPQISIHLPATIVASAQSPPASDFVVAGTGSDSTPATTLEGTGLTLDYSVQNPDGSFTDLQSSSLGADSHLAGTYKVVATFSGSQDYAVTSKQALFTITPAQPSSFLFNGGTVPQVTAGVPFSVTVEPVDQFGNPTSDPYGSTFTGAVSVVSTTDPKAVLPATFPALAITNSGLLNAVNTGTISNLVLKTASTTAVGGNQTITFSIDGISSTCTIFVMPSALSSLAVKSPATATVQASTTTPYNLTVDGLDQFGNLANPPSTATTAFTDSLAGAVISPTTGAFNNGVLQVPVVFQTASTTVQTLTVKVTVPPPSTGGGSTTFTAPTVGVTVNPGPLTSFAVSASTATAGTAFNETLTAVDQFGNKVTNSGGVALTGTATISFSAPNPQETTPTSAAFTAGVTTLSNLTVSSATAQKITVSLPLSSGTVTAASQPINVGFAAVSQFVLDSASNPIPAKLNTVPGSFTFTLDADDKFSNLVGNFAGAVNITVTPNADVHSPATATFSAGKLTLTETLSTAGNQTVTVATAGGGVNASFTTPTINVDPVFAIQSPTSVSAGTPFSVTVTARDGSGHTITNFTGSVRLTSTDPLAPRLGTFIFTAADKGVLTIKGLVLKTSGSEKLTVSWETFTNTHAVTVVPGPLAKLVVSSAPKTATAGTPFAVTVTAEDAYGNTITSYAGAATLRDSLSGSLVGPTTGTFSKGVLKLTGVTLQKAGSQTLTVTSGTHKVTTHSITVSAAALARFAVSGPSTVTAGAPFSLTVTAQDKYGNTVTSFVGTVHLTSTDPKVPSLGSLVLTAGNMGSRTMTALKLRTKTVGSATDTMTVTFESGLKAVHGTWSLKVV